MEVNECPLCGEVPDETVSKYHCPECGIKWTKPAHKMAMSLQPNRPGALDTVSDVLFSKSGVMTYVTIIVWYMAVVMWVILILLGFYF